MSESTEPSYYEIALTNRQVVIAFVILLTLVLAIFLCGVWVGKNGQERLAGAGGDAPGSSTAADPDQLANMEEFKFFSEEGKGRADGEALNRPDLSVLDKPAGQPQTPPSQTPTSQAPASQAPPQTLAQEVGSAPTDRPADREPAQSAPPPSAPPPPAPAQSAPPPPEPAPPSRPEPAADDGFVVQVFSTRDAPQARKVLQELKGSGHQAFLSAVEVTGQTMYRVRVGPFAQRTAAEQVADQVRRQMKLDPWVTAAGN